MYHSPGGDRFVISEVVPALVLLALPAAEWHGRGCIQGGGITVVSRQLVSAM